MNIPWRIKSAAYSIAQKLDAGYLIGIASKYITRSIYIDKDKLPEHFYIHLENLRSLERPNIIEFGAGKHLGQNLFLSQLANSQTCVDITDLFDAELCDRVASVVSGLAGIEYFSIRSKSDLKKYNINYIAPLDMRSSSFSDGKFDASVSTFTLEHLAVSDIYDIFYEMRRILRSGGIVSIIIDYSDHYSHTDKRIGPLHFLRYSDSEYKKYNHLSNYMNRLRHDDFERIFSEIGFKIVKSNPFDFVDRNSVQVCDDFDVNAPNTYACRGEFVIMNP